jgi:hypothetical protein
VGTELQEKPVEKVLKRGLGAQRKARRARRDGQKAALLGFLKFAGMPSGAALTAGATDTPGELPKRIHLYWHDGWDKAPQIAEICLRSWRQRNPGYEIVALDYASLGSALDDPPVHQGVTKLSAFANRVRLRLLATRGGIWADATNFCTRPIDSWIHERVAPARFFAFTLPLTERPIATWFLAAAPHAPLMVAWERMVARYFRYIDAERRDVHAYFFMPYLFEYAVERDAGLRGQWELMPKIAVDQEGRVTRESRITEPGIVWEPPTEEAWAVIAGTLATASMQKLTWKGQMKTGTPTARRLLDLLQADLEARPTGLEEGRNSAGPESRAPR